MTTQTEKQMTTYRACAIVEGFSGEEHTEAEQIAAWQHLIDTGDVWKLHGAYGRMAQSLIEQGICTEAR